VNEADEKRRPLQAGWRPNAYEMKKRDHKGRIRLMQDLVVYGLRHFKQFRSQYKFAEGRGDTCGKFFPPCMRSKCRALCTDQCSELHCPDNRSCCKAEHKKVFGVEKPLSNERSEVKMKKHAKDCRKGINEVPTTVVRRETQSCIKYSCAVCKHSDKKLGEAFWRRRRKGFFGKMLKRGRGLIKRVRRGAGKAFSFLRKKIKRIKRKLWRKMKRRLIKGIARGVYKIVRKLARKFHAQGLLKIFHKGKGAKTPIGYVLQGRIGKAKKAFSKVWRSVWLSGQLAQTLSDIVMPNALLLMAKNSNPYNAADRLVKKIVHFMAVCSTVQAVLDFQRPSYLVSNQMWQVGGDQGFLDRSKNFTTWRTYFVKATPRWWKERARQHSHAKDIRSEDGIVTMWGRKIDIDKVVAGEEKDDKGKTIKKDSDEYRLLLKLNSKRKHPDYSEKLKHMKPKAIVDSFVEKARIAINQGSFYIPDLCWSQQRNECPFVPSEKSWKDGEVPKNTLPYNNITALERDPKANKPEEQQPLCVAKVDMQIYFCTTCCCKDGYASQDMTSVLQYENDPTCALWFSVQDAVIRIISAVVRGLTTATRFELCFETTWRDKSKNKGLGEGQGRRGGGGGGLASAGTFSMGSSNRAGNSELLGMANARIQELTTRVQELEARLEQ